MKINSTNTATPFLTTLEIPTTSESTYMEYWLEYRHQNPEEFKSAEQSSRINQLASFVSSLTVNVIRGAETIQSVKSLNLVPEGKRDLAGAIETWDRTIGGFNHMSDGEGDMLRAAGILLVDNVSDDKEKESNTVPGEPADIFEAFTSLFENIDIGKQKPTPELLVAGQLIHKAGWVEQNPERRKKLFDIADKTYSRLYEDKDQPWSDTKMLAGQFLMDIRFHELSLQLRKLNGSDTVGLETVRDKSVDMIRQQIADLSKTKAILDKAPTLSQRNELAGLMLEGFVLIAQRDRIYLNTNWDVATSLEVRRAFSHEDEPIAMYIKPKQAFDIVIQRYNNHGELVHTTPVQLKLRQDESKGKSAEDEKRDYRPEIEYIRVTKHSPSSMMKAADELLAAYADRDFRRGIGTLRDIQRLLDSKLIKSGS